MSLIIPSFRYSVIESYPSMIDFILSTEEFDSTFNIEAGNAKGTTLVKVNSTLFVLTDDITKMARCKRSTIFDLHKNVNANGIDQIGRKVITQLIYDHLDMHMEEINRMGINSNYEPPPLEFIYEAVLNY